MIKESELLRTIQELEDSPQSYQNCEKLATFYSIYDHLYSRSEAPPARTGQEVIIGQHGDSEFLQAIEGTDAEKAWAIIGELMEILKRLQPKLYDSVLKQIQE